VATSAVFAGLDGHHIGADRPDSQRGGDAGDDISVLVVAVQQQDLHQRPGAGAPAVGVSRRGPERLMGAGERADRTGLDQRGRAAQGAGLRISTSR